MPLDSAGALPATQPDLGANQEGPPGKRQGPGLGNRSPASRRADDETTVALAADHAGHFRARVLVEAMLDGWTVHNERQAHRWEASRPRPNDFLGGSTVEAQRARWQRMTAVAAAYRNRSTIAPLDELTADLLSVVRHGEDHLDRGGEDYLDRDPERVVAC